MKTVAYSAEELFDLLADSADPYQHHHHRPVFVCPRDISSSPNEDYYMSRLPVHAHPEPRWAAPPPPDHYRHSIVERPVASTSTAFSSPSSSVTPSMIMTRSPSSSASSSRRPRSVSPDDARNVRPRLDHHSHDSTAPRPASPDGATDTSDGSVWTDDVEDAFWLAVRILPKLGQGKMRIGSGKPLGRNQLISEIILHETGKERKRKQVMSHVKVLKDRAIKSRTADGRREMALLVDDGGTDARRQIWEFDSIEDLITTRKRALNIIP